MENINSFNQVLHSFNLKAACVDYQTIGNYAYYDLRLESKTKIKDIQRYSDEISLAIRSPSKPFIKIMHTLGVVRLEFVTPRVNPLRLFDYFKENNQISGEVPCLIGQKLNGDPIWMDLAMNPHLIIAGTTGSGKSTLLHNIIANLIYYNKTKLYLIDPKHIEFSEYENRITSNVSVSYSYDDTIEVLDTIIDTMDNRYDLIRKGVASSNFPSIVVMIDEFADLIMQDKDNQFYSRLCKLAQKSRVAKIYLVVSTQRPSTNVIDGTIKANFPARIACKVASHVDSKVILDYTGAENLLGKGDSILRDNFRMMERFQVAYTDAKEVCSHFGK